MAKFFLSETLIDDAALKQQLRHDQCGGFCCFEGWVRNHNNHKSVSGLRYSTYRELAEVEGQRIVEQACEQFDIADAYCQHRIGVLAIGDMAVWVGVSAAHRDAAFAACRFIIDEVKASVPIWKQERYVSESEQTQWLANPEAL